MPRAGHALVPLDRMVVAGSLSVGLTFSLTKGVPDTNDIAALRQGDEAGLVVVVRVVRFAQGRVADRRENHGEFAGAVARQIQI